MFKIKNLFDFGFNVINENYNIIHLALITNILMLFILGLFTILNIFSIHNYTLAFVEFFFCITTFLNLYFFQKNKKKEKFLLNTTIILFGTSIGFYIYIDKTLFSAVWLFFFPLIVFLLNGLEVGRRFALLYLFIIIIYTYFGVGVYTDWLGFLRISLSLILFTYFVYLFEKSRKEAFGKIITLMQHLEHLSKRDELTSLYNRHYMNEHILKEYSSYTKPFIFCITDIDNFKSYNDIYGHQMGDKTLRTIAQIKQNTLQEKNKDCFVIRLGGEEFGGFLFECNNDSKSKINEFIQKVYNEQIPHIGNEPYKVCTVSVGAVICDTNTEFSKIYQLADKALYLAKRNGKNRVIFKNLV
ncbi:MAG: GGDEF domain-containing protein [Epsilonproteobacteria bacterium]|nr:GGDEF domain-containing protein [Campylobacterota bacterium]